MTGVRGAKVTSINATYSWFQQKWPKIKGNLAVAFVTKSGRKDSNLRYPAPKAGAIATRLRPETRMEYTGLSENGSRGSMGGHESRRTYRAHL